MRLLDVRTKKLHTFYGDSIPPYAILSHTWGKDYEEVTFAQIQNPEQCHDILGYKKIELSCQQAEADKLDYTWIDTCCIDKSSSAELSEAINSMFEWYYNAKVCYAYLADIDQSNGDDFLSSRWWSRSWTLQELLAPSQFELFDKNWIKIGGKADLAAVISIKTGVDEDTLKNRSHMFFRSIAQRMSWASSRIATRVEDVAYCLLGIFQINMSLQYGEGQLAFVRLQEEILKKTNDQSLFAWSFSPHTIEELVGSILKQEKTEPAKSLVQNVANTPRASSYGMFAMSPSLFKDSGHIVFHHRFAPDPPITQIHDSLHMEMPVVDLLEESLRDFYGHKVRHQKRYQIGLLPCGLLNAGHDMIGILLRGWKHASDEKAIIEGEQIDRAEGRFQRVSAVANVCTFLVHSKTACTAKTDDIWIDKSFRIEQFNHTQSDQSRLQLSVVVKAGYFLSRGYNFAEAVPAVWVWDSKDSTLFLKAPSHKKNRMIFGFFSREKKELIAIFLELNSNSMSRIKLFCLPATDESKQRVLEQVLDDHESQSVSHAEPKSSWVGTHMATINSRKIFNQVIFALYFREIKTAPNSPKFHLGDLARSRTLGIAPENWD